MKDPSYFRKKECGARIRSMRMNLGLTQEDLAKQLHTSVSNISKIEIGASNPSFELMIEIRNFFNVPIDYLLIGPSDLPNSLKDTLQETLDSLFKLERQIRNLNIYE